MGVAMYLGMAMYMGVAMYMVWLCTGCGYEQRSQAQVLDEGIEKTGGKRRSEHLVYDVHIFVSMCCASVHIVWW